MRLFAGTPWDHPPTCEKCGRLEEECQCPPAEAPPAPLIPPDKQTARVHVEKRKRGKFVTVVSGLDPKGNDLPALLSTLQAACGAGGALKNGELEIQGQQLPRVQSALREIGYRVK